MLALMTLAFGAFVAQTTEYLPIGLLPQIGESFGVSEGVVGALVTGYAWIAAVSAIPLTIATRRVRRKTLFLSLLAIISVANVIASFTPTYATFAAMRVVVALTHGVFWSILASFATRVAPRMPAARATAWVFAGISLSVVAGVPLAIAIGQWADWRTAFRAFAALGAIGVAAGTAMLPPLASLSIGTSPALPQRNRVLYGAAAVTALILTAHFCSYTYIVPLLRNVAAVPNVRLPLLFLVFGVAGVAGNGLAGLGSRRPAAELVGFAASGILASQALMAFTRGLPAFAWLEMLLWGASISLLIVGLQSWVLEIAPKQPDAASALYVATFNAGIGTGALLGALVLATRSPRMVLFTGIACAIAAIITLVFVQLVLRQGRVEG